MARESGPSVLSRANLTSERLFIVTMIVIVVSMVAGAWVWAIKGKMWFFDPEYPMWLANMQMLDACDVGETAVLGDSRAKAAAIPGLISDKTVNLSVGGASPIETNRVVETIIGCPAPPKRVVFTFAPAYLTDVQVYWARSAPFNYLNFDQLEEVRKTSLELNDPMLYSTSSIHTIFDKIANYGYWVNFPSHYFPAMVNAGFVGRKARNEIELDKTLLDRGHHYFGMDDQSDWISGEAMADGFEPPRLVNYYFEKAISALESKGIKVYFAPAPLNEATYKRLSPNFVKEYLAYIATIRSRHPGFEVLGNPLPYLPNDNFGDCEHVNPRGAKAFSESVARLLSAAMPSEKNMSRL